jgi:hypothetical protein
MRNTIAIILALAVIALTSQVGVHAFSCGKNNSNLANVGMHKNQILKDCGPPASREAVGWDKRGGKIRIAEEWTYIQNNYGKRQMYLLRINGQGYVAEIEWLGEVK